MKGLLKKLLVLGAIVAIGYAIYRYLKREESGDWETDQPAAPPVERPTEQETNVAEGPASEPVVPVAPEPAAESQPVAEVEREPEPESPVQVATAPVSRFQESLRTPSAAYVARGDGDIFA